jgi:hypothetical protein
MKGRRVERKGNAKKREGEAEHKEK